MARLLLFLFLSLEVGVSTTLFCGPAPLPSPLLPPLLRRTADSSSSSSSPFLVATERHRPPTTTTSSQSWEEIRFCASDDDCEKPLYCCVALLFDVCCADGVPVRSRNGTNSPVVFPPPLSPSPLPA